MSPFLVRRYFVICLSGMLINHFVHPDPHQFLLLPLLHLHRGHHSGSQNFLWNCMFLFSRFSFVLDFINYRMEPSSAQVIIHVTIHIISVGFIIKGCLTFIRLEMFWINWSLWGHTVTFDYKIFWKIRP